MPEGDVIYQYAAILSNFLYQNPITNIKILSGRYLRKPICNLDKITYPVTVVDIGTKGKFLWIQLSNDNYLFITHGMTGTWVKETAGSHPRYNFNDPKHHRIELVTPKGSIYYNDYRNFGTFQVICDKNILDAKLDELGPDILDDSITEERFYERMPPTKKIGLILMDQKVVSGIGNYLRAEILWYARISPHRLFKTLTVREKTKLFDAAYNLIRFFTNKQRTKKYPSMNPTKLEYHLNIEPEEFFVYQQKTDYYGNEVITEKLGERTIHWVEQIQK